MTIDFATAFAALTAPLPDQARAQTAGLPSGRRPFRWQQRLFDMFCQGIVPDACDIPTGLGKTSVLSIWLAALDLTRAENRLPRRLVYVVDRRAVVDQATEEAASLAQNLDDTTGSAPPVVAELRRRLRLRRGQTLPVSTLRGQLADNRAWLDDPTAPAIVVGTVDMIGSRLLFQAYGVSPRMRPVHAALLGHDALIVLDEAHLVPPFQTLIEQVSGLTKDSARESQVTADAPFAIPPMRTMALSATGRGTKGLTFALAAEDVEKDATIRQRVGAPKWLRLEETSTSRLAEMMAARALSLGAEGERIVIFCNSRKTAQDVYNRLERALGKQASRGDNIELIVGARRVREREQLASSFVFRRFAHAAKGDAPAGNDAAFLVATSAGEVGVDIDAEHMVCDLVAWERMVQRLGRVNRRGEHPESLVEVFVAAPDKEAETPPGTPSIEACREPFVSPRWKPRSDGRRDTSPATLLRLREDSDFRELTDAATTGEALRPALTKAVVDAWSMTSLEAHTGRPQVAPWIRGWVDEEAPQTEVLWRQSLPLRPDDAEQVVTRELAAFFDQAPPHLSEILETETYRVVDLLRARAKRVSRKSSDFAGDPAEDAEAGDEGSAQASLAPLASAADAAAPRLNRRSAVAVVLDRDGSVAELLLLQDILDRDVRRLHSSFANRRVVFDARLGGRRHWMVPALRRSRRKARRLYGATSA
jgi:CRISPR-associated endonuclease/helicase Cas3